MKRLLFIVVVLVTTSLFVSCTDEKDEDSSPKKYEISEIIGSWKEVTGNSCIELNAGDTFTLTMSGKTSTGTYYYSPNKLVLYASGMSGSIDATVKSVSSSQLVLEMFGSTYTYNRKSSSSSNNSGSGNVSSNGTIVLVNQSAMSNTYKVTINGVEYNVAAGSQTKVSGLVAGSYNIQVLQTSGYISGYQVKYNNTATLKENQTLLYSFPQIGKIKVVNNEEDPYYVSINGVNYGLLPVGKTLTVNADCGYYQIKVEQASGYLLWASKQTYTGTVKENITTTATIQNL